MRGPLISHEHPLWKNALGCVATVVILPVAILVKLVSMPFERPRNRTADEVARYLRDFVEGTGGQWDFDDFEHIPIADPRLDSIRDRASRVQLPITDDGWQSLRSLLAEAEALAEEERQPD